MAIFVILIFRLYFESIILNTLVLGWSIRVDSKVFWKVS